MKTNITELRNLGPASEQALIKAGIFSKEEVLKLGAYKTYDRLLLSGYRPHRAMLYALIGACEDKSFMEVANAMRQHQRGF